MFAVYATSLVLIGLSGLMLDWHRRSWRAAQQDASLDTRGRRYAEAQYRRRMQASSIIGVLGAAIGMGPLVPLRPWPMVLYVASLAGACGCMTILAAIDAWATHQNYVRLRNEQIAAQLKVAREVRLAREASRDDR
jgi:hypothetical protein